MFCLYGSCQSLICLPLHSCKQGNDHTFAFLFFTLCCLSGATFALILTIISLARQSSLANISRLASIVCLTSLKYLSTFCGYLICINRNGLFTVQKSLVKVLFSLNRPHWADSVIVAMSVGMCAPLGAVFLEASHGP